MPSKVRIISPKNSAQWDDLIRDAARSLGNENTYFGIVNNERADKVRRGLRTAGRHIGVAVKAYWKECPEAGRCSLGGNDCQFHVYYTVFDMDTARSYKARAAQAAAGGR